MSGAMTAASAASAAGAGAAGASAAGGLMSMGTLAGIAGGMQVGGMFTQALGARAQAQATQDAYNYQAAVSKNNAMLAEWQAQDALQRGATAEQQQRLKTAGLSGAQRARLAANGVSLNEGSPLNILDDTAFLGQQDALTIRDNANREAWGYRNQAANSSNEASVLRAQAGAQNPNGAAGMSLLTSATQVAPSWYRYSQTLLAPAPVTKPPAVPTPTPPSAGGK